MRPLPLRKAASTASSAMVAAMPIPATIRAARACPGARAKTAIAAMISGAGMSASWSPPPSIVALPPGAGQRRRSDLSGAVRADPPTQAEAAVASRAPPGELGPAVRAEDELLLDLASAGRTRSGGYPLHRGLEEHLLLDGEGSHLLHRHRRSHHEIDQRAEEWGHETEQHREQRKAGRGRAPARVADDVEGQREPEHDDVGDHNGQHRSEQRPQVN